MQKAQMLLEEGRGLVGMLAEAGYKCQLVQQSLDNDCISEHQAQDRIGQIKTDVELYTRRMTEICEELERYDIISEF